MSTFNFGDVNTTSAVNNSSNLKPWGIYDVEFDGLELNDIQGFMEKKDLFLLIYLFQVLKMILNELKIKVKMVTFIILLQNLKYLNGLCFNLFKQLILKDMKN